MTDLTLANWNKAQHFMENKARPLEQALFAYYFSNGTVDAVLKELAPYSYTWGNFLGGRSSVV